MTTSIAQPVRVLVDPVDGVPEAISARRWFWPLALLVVATCFSGVALSLRMDLSGPVMAKLAMTGKLKTISDQDLADQLTSAQHLALVAAVAKGLFGMPLIVLMMSVVVKLAGWLIGRPVPFKRVFSIVAVALVPIAVYHLVLGGCALAQAQIAPREMMRLVPSSLASLAPPGNLKLAGLLSAVDFFNLWSVLLLGLGYSAASGMGKARGVLFALVLYACFVGVFLVGLPGMMAAGHGAGMHGGGPHR